MGYEFKFKESEARMMKTFITGVLFVFMVAVANAQSPNLMQPVDPLVPQIDNAPVETPETTPTPPWQKTNRVLTCNAMNVVRVLLEDQGQYIYATGIKSPVYIPADPFDGVIITKNPTTKEYTIMLVKTDLNLACVVAAGQRFDIITELQGQAE